MIDKLWKAIIGLKPRPSDAIGRSLYAQTVTQARDVRLFTDYGVKDEIGARFEVLTVHILILISILRADAEDELRKETAQALFDAFLLALDNTLREQGVGDLTVPKKMKKLTETVNARLHAWIDIWDQGGDHAVQTDYLLRTVYALGDEEVADSARPLWAEAFSHYITAVRAGLEPSQLVKGQVDWLRSDWPAVTAHSHITAEV
ncbi:MAG: ubiquinol-cytochrome C chaperone family protein [Asticcacaulis sp.]